MRPLFSEKSLLELERVFHEQPVLIFDYDGTLVPIIDDPKKSFLPESRKRLLKQLATQLPCVILTGRRLGEIEIFLKGISFKAVIGNHGLEKGGLSPKTQMRFRKTVREWKPLLSEVIEPFEGAWLEDKGLSLTAHYRLASQKKRVVQAILAATKRHPRLRRATLIRGKATINFMPSEKINKGSAVLSVMKRLKRRSAIFLGDDVTDEYVFKIAKRNRVFGIYVGNRSSAATYRMDLSEIDRFLKLAKRLTS